MIVTPEESRRRSEVMRALHAKRKAEREFMATHVVPDAVPAPDSEWDKPLPEDIARGNARCRTALDEYRNLTAASGVSHIATE
jgi:hypothetical protein